MQAMTPRRPFAGSVNGLLRRGKLLRSPSSTFMLRLSHTGKPSMSDAWAGLSPPYRCIVADPPWRYGNQKGAVARGHARSHYSTMDFADIQALPVQDLADESCHLWLWGVNQLLDKAFDLARTWGFEPITVATWCKTQPGVGYYLRNSTEHVVFATRGKPMVPETKAMTTWFQWQRGAHSAKPVGFYDVVQTVSPGPYVELFCRQPIFGWDTWGKGFELQDGAA